MYPHSATLSMDHFLQCTPSQRHLVSRFGGHTKIVTDAIPADSILLGRPVSNVLSQFYTIMYMIEDNIATFRYITIWTRLVFQLCQARALRQMIEVQRAYFNRLLWNRKHFSFWRKYFIGHKKKGCFDFHRFWHTAFHMKCFMSGAQFNGFVRIQCKFILHKLFKVWRQNCFFFSHLSIITEWTEKSFEAWESHKSAGECYHDGHFDSKTRRETPKLWQLVQNEFAIFLLNICRSRIRRQNSSCRKPYLQVCENRSTLINSISNIF